MASVTKLDIEYPIIRSGQNLTVRYDGEEHKYTVVEIFKYEEFPVGAVIARRKNVTIRDNLVLMITPDGPKWKIAKVPDNEHDVILEESFTVVPELPSDILGKILRYDIDLEPETISELKYKSSVFNEAITDLDLCTSSKSRMLRCLENSVSTGNMRFLNKLIDNGGDILDVASYASKYDNIEIFMEMVGRMSRDEDYFKMVIGEAARFNRKNLVDTLLEMGGDIDNAGKYALKYGHLDLVSHLIERGAIVDDINLGMKADMNVIQTALDAGYDPTHLFRGVSMVINRELIDFFINRGVEIGNAIAGAVGGSQLFEKIGKTYQEYLDTIEYLYNRGATLAHARQGLTVMTDIQARDNIAEYLNQLEARGRN